MEFRTVVELFCLGLVLANATEDKNNNLHWAAQWLIEFIEPFSINLILGKEFCVILF